jgi:hypothetical protein
MCGAMTLKYHAAGGNNHLPVYVGVCDRHPYDSKDKAYYAHWAGSSRETHTLVVNADMERVAKRIERLKYYLECTEDNRRIKIVNEGMRSPMCSGLELRNHRRMGKSAMNKLRSYLAGLDVDF